LATPAGQEAAVFCLFEDGSMMFLGAFVEAEAKRKAKAWGDATGLEFYTVKTKQKFLCKAGQAGQASTPEQHPDSTRDVEKNRDHTQELSKRATSKRVWTDSRGMDFTTSEPLARPAEPPKRQVGVRINRSTDPSRTLSGEVHEAVVATTAASASTDVGSLEIPEPASRRRAMPPKEQPEMNPANPPWAFLGALAQSLNDAQRASLLAAQQNGHRVKIEEVKDEEEEAKAETKEEENVEEPEEEAGVKPAKDEVEEREVKVKEPDEAAKEKTTEEAKKVEKKDVDERKVLNKMGRLLISIFNALINADQQDENVMPDPDQADPAEMQELRALLNSSPEAQRKLKDQIPTFVAKVEDANERAADIMRLKDIVDSAISAKKV